MVDISKIQEPIVGSLDGFDTFVTTMFRSDESLMQSMLVDALGSRGKGVRPMLVFLAFGLSGGTDCERANVAAMMCEMIHLASLIHDDVIDEAATRRGRPTINSKWQSKRAVLCGDYILAKNLSIGMGSGHYDLVGHIVEAIGRLCEGEVLQDDCARRGVASREEYMRVIELKTASLLSVSASSGALAAGATAERVAAMGEFGRLIGLAFQIQDDILDYEADDALGKERGQDLAEGKFTLPLLMALEVCEDVAQRDHIADLVRSGVETEADMAEAMQFVQFYKGIELSREVAESHLANADKLLNQFEPSNYKESLILLSDYILARNK